jgi:hypothetical protein
MANLTCIVAAALFFGDPRHAANQAYNTGTGASRNGVSKSMCPSNARQRVDIAPLTDKPSEWCSTDLAEPLFQQNPILVFGRR